jgi:hypothetical protein
MNWEVSGKEMKNLPAKLNLARTGSDIKEFRSMVCTQQSVQKYIPILLHIRRKENRRQDPAPWSPQFGNSNIYTLQTAEIYVTVKPNLVGGVSNSSISVHTVRKPPL